MYRVWQLGLKLSRISPEPQRVSLHAKYDRSFNGVEIPTHVHTFFLKIEVQARVSTPVLSIHGNCLESARQGAASNFSQYKDTIPLTFKSTFKEYRFTNTKKPQQV